jgi:transcriptional regulator with GAF, ATPase, and Fis domain
MREAERVATQMSLCYTETGTREMANRSTVFLDDICELPPQLPAKLLQIMQHSRFRRIGLSHPIKNDFKFLTVTPNLCTAFEELKRS